MRYPKSLKPNGKIGIIAPSFGATTEPYASRVKAALSRFSDMGYECVLGPNIYKADGVGKSTSALACGDEINDFFLNDKSDIIISCGGGETMCEDLEFVDFKGIAKAEPKWFEGFSDNTNLVFTLATLCDTASIYGPCLASFGMSKWHPSLEDAFGLMSGASKKDASGAPETEKHIKLQNYNGWELEDDESGPLATYNIDSAYNQKIYVGDKKVDKVEFSGRLLGGCMDCLNILCGTKYDAVARPSEIFGVDAFNDRYAEDGVVWFLEACDLDPIGVRRVLWQLGQSDWFKNAKGFIIGRPARYGEQAFGLNHYDAVLSILAKYNIPVVIDVDLGHLPPMMPLICGAKAGVVAREQTFDIDMSLE